MLDLRPGVAASRVLGVPHPTLGEVVHAEVVPKAGAELDAVRSPCQRRLSAHRAPQRNVVVATVPMTGSGMGARASPCRSPAG